MSIAEKIPVKEKIGYSLAMQRVILYLTHRWPFWRITIRISMDYPRP